jgi:hypothetical protein
MVHRISILCAFCTSCMFIMLYYYINHNIIVSLRFHINTIKEVQYEILDIQLRIISNEGARHVWLLNSGKTHHCHRIGFDC